MTSAFPRRPFEYIDDNLNQCYSDGDPGMSLRLYIAVELMKELASASYGSLSQENIEEAFEAAKKMIEYEESLP